jgi:hypothetical protein
LSQSDELAQLLLRKAAQDEYLLRKIIPDPDVSDEAIGFHAQQAIEKLVKAVLAKSRVRYPHTHDLFRLIQLARTTGFSFPSELEDIDRLTPYAVGFRYTDQISQFDRKWVVGQVTMVRAWAEAIVQSP